MVISNPDEIAASASFKSCPVKWCSFSFIVNCLLISSILIPAAFANAFCANMSWFLNPTPWFNCSNISFWASTVLPAYANPLAVDKLNWPPTNVAATNSSSIPASKSNNFSAVAATLVNVVPNWCACITWFLRAVTSPLKNVEVASAFSAISSNTSFGDTLPCWANDATCICKLAAVSPLTPATCSNIPCTFAAVSDVAPVLACIPPNAAYVSVEKWVISPNTFAKSLLTSNICFNSTPAFLYETSISCAWCARCSVCLTVIPEVFL